MAIKGQVMAGYFRDFWLEHFSLTTPVVAKMAPTEVQSQTRDVELCPGDSSLQDDSINKKPVTADEAVEIAIGESSNVEYTIDSDNSP